MPAGMLCFQKAIVLADDGDGDPRQLCVCCDCWPERSGADYEKLGRLH